MKWNNSFFHKLVEQKHSPQRVRDLGGHLADLGPSMYFSAAQHFYRALKVYPNPAELLDIYKKTVPEGAYNMILGIREAEQADSSNPSNLMD